MLNPSNAATLSEFLAVAARVYGASPALVIKPSIRNRITTYAQLEATALQTARYLQLQGIRKGDRVLLWASNMPEWVSLYFACHIIGAILVPLDVRSARSFVDRVIESTQPELFVVSRVTARQAGDLTARVVHLEEIQSQLPREAELVEPVEVGPDDIAEIVFTSGTTGDPKGVILTHRNILSDVRGANAVFPSSPSFRLVSLLPLSHMFEQTVGLLAPLSGGARIIYPSSRQSTVLFRTIAEHRANMIVTVPQALQLLLQAIRREARRQHRERELDRLQAIARHAPCFVRRMLFRSVHERLGGNLEFLIVGGAYLDPALAEQWERMGVQVRQGYGTTEAAPIIASDDIHGRKPGAVGRPLPGVDVQIAPDGEILARGQSIFSGYWQRPDATAGALADGWYHTGDLGFIDDEGYLHLNGRKKDLIVLASGEKVYPEDVEAELDRHPAVSEGVVLGLEGSGGQVEVHAVLLMRDASRAEEAVNAANASLAEHQAVRGYTVWPLDDFPRTNTLKVKKHEVLEGLERLRAGLPPGDSVPGAAICANPLHQLIGELSSVPAAALRPDQTLGGDLGLDSLQRVELLSAIEGELGAYVDETEVTPDTTIRELECHVSAAQERDHRSSFVRWPLSVLGTIAREAFLQLFLFPAYHLFWDVRVVGREYLSGVPQPVIVAANHHFRVWWLGADPGAAWMALPREIRLRVCTAGEEHAVFDNPVNRFLSHLLNAFPLSKAGNVRRSLEYAGRLLDLGYSILIFPEGTLTEGGPLKPFMSGTGMLAVEGGVPVVPMWIEVERKSVLQGSRTPWRGAFTTYIGSPLSFSTGTLLNEATRQIESAVCGLNPRADSECSCSSGQDWVTDTVSRG